MKDALKGIDGISSTKRIIAFSISVGMIMIAFYAVFNDTTEASNVLWPLASVASIALGATAAERLKKT